MTHQPGEPINIASYNDIISQVNTIFGTGTGSSGYGGNSANVPGITDLPAKIAGDVIDNQDWLDLRNAQADVATHQGAASISVTNTLPVVGDLQDADLAKAFDDQTGPDNPDGEIDSVANLALIATNKDLVDGTSVTIAAITTPGFPSVRNTSWSSFIKHEFTVDFGSTDDARFFFNTGGQLRISATRTGGSATPQNADWDAILLSGGIFILDGPAYFLLTGAYSSTPPVGQSTVSPGYGTYGQVNTWTISSKRDDAAGPNGGNGSVLRFKSSFLDGHTGLVDFVDGTFTSIIEERRSTNTFIKPSPTFTTITGLTAGS